MPSRRVLRNATRALTCAILFPCLTLAHAAPLAEAKPLTVQALESLERVAEYRLSPDGRFVAVITVAPKASHQPGGDGKSLLAAYSAQLRIIDTRNGDTRFVHTASENIENAEWSPDGSQLAFIGGQEQQARLWVWSRVTEVTRAISDVVPVTWPPTFNRVLWLADSRSVILLVQPQREADAGARRSGENKVSDTHQDEAREASNDEVKVYSANIEPSASDGTTERAAKVSEELPELDSYYKNDVALIDATIGNYKRILVGHRPVSISLAPDSRKLAYADLIRIEKGNVMEFDISVLDVTGGLPRVLQPDVFQSAPSASFLNATWSPDSRLISFLDSGEGAQHDCYFADVESGLVKRVGAGLRAALESPELANRTFAPATWLSNTDAFILIGGPESQAVWRIRTNGESSRIFPQLRGLSPGNKVIAVRPMKTIQMSQNGLLVHTQNARNGDEGLAILDISTGTLNPVYEQPAALGDVVEESVAGKILVYSEERADHSMQLYATDTHFRHRRQLTYLNASLSDFRLGQSRLVHWRGPNGDVLEGALLLPAAYTPGTRYPLIVQIYGGSHGSGDIQSTRKLNTFGMSGPGHYAIPFENLQLFATRGYAVLYADTVARVGTPMHDIAQSLMPGINEVIDEGIVDGNRMGLLGHSYGGYSVFSVLVQTDRFKAAVASAAPINLIDSYSMLWATGTAAWSISWAEDSQGRMGGSLWDRRDRFIENSPMFFLDRVSTPILLMHGTADTAVSIREGDEAFVSLRRLGKTVQYVQYVGEGHGIAGSANMRDWVVRMLAWFDKYLAREPNEIAGEAQPERR